MASNEEVERDQLIEFLLEDWANSIAETGFDPVRHILLYGHDGYAEMHIDDLRQQAEDAGYEPDEEDE